MFALAASSFIVNSIFAMLLFVFLHLTRSLWPPPHTFASLFVTMLDAASRMAYGGASVYVCAK